MGLVIEWLRKENIEVGDIIVLPGLHTLEPWKITGVTKHGSFELENSRGDCRNIHLHDFTGKDKVYDGSGILIKEKDAVVTIYASKEFLRECKKAKKIK